ncbi:MAG TPA: HAD family hydrolase [Longimicrobiales bacterium]|nr:HAD family hydrolase [Longimicrobiales bacterium]
MNPRDEIRLVLVDFDDTLVDTAPRFDNARRALFALMEAQGFDADDAYRLHHHEIDPVLRQRHGFGPARLQDAFRLTYRMLCERAGREPDPALLAECGELGRSVIGTPPVIAGALDALTRLAAALPVVVYTQAGDVDYQMSCLREAGVLNVVPQERVRVVPSKTTDAFRETLAAYAIGDPAAAWMVGNSIRSDVNPALSAGARAILVEIEEPWHHDIVEPVRDDFERVPSFAAAVDRLLRR